MNIQSRCNRRVRKKQSNNFKHKEEHYKLAEKKTYVSTRAHACVYMQTYIHTYITLEVFCNRENRKWRNKMSEELKGRLPATESHVKTRNNFAVINFLHLFIVRLLPSSSSSPLPPPLFTSSSSHFHYPSLPLILPSPPPPLSIPPHSLLAPV